VQALAHWVTPHAGGQGAVRDVCDLLLMASGHYARLWREALA
jgi:3-deoxy-D-manno-octulosonate 8-phosphate phosphatase (KDO 8-P phosphatase)